MMGWTGDDGRADVRRTDSRVQELAVKSRLFTEHTTAVSRRRQPVKQRRQRAKTFDVEVGDNAAERVQDEILA